MTTTFKDIQKIVETLAPSHLAQDKDPIGLHFGSPNQKVKKILVTLDIRPEVVEEAIRLDVDMIVAHHPPIFRGIQSFNVDIPQNAMYAELIKHDIAVLAAHTNIDAAQSGMNDWLAEALQLENTKILKVTQDDGIEQFGYGRVGNLAEKMPFKKFVDYVKSVFEVDGLRYVGEDLEREIEKVAIMGGDGGSTYTNALAQGADVLVTGDLYYHTAHDIQAAGLYAVDPGHHIERIFIPKMTHYINRISSKEGYELEVIPSTLNTDPFRFA